MMRAGFTLIELVVVVGIIALLAAMTVGAFRNPDPGAEVRQAAEQLAATFRQARALAMERRAPHGVAFNLANAAGSSGRVLNNRDGGHWYRIIGPARNPAVDGSGNFAETIPWLPSPGSVDLSETHNESPVCPLALGPCNNVAKATLPGFDNVDSQPRSVQMIYPTFPHLIEAIREAWVDERRILPRGRVRFLALGDCDEGPRWAYRRARNYSAATAQDGNRSYGYGHTHPRPWFGLFRDGRLYPWGGYDPALPAVQSLGGLGPRSLPIGGSSTPPVSPLPYPMTDASRSLATYSGLFYQGLDEPPIPDSRNPADRPVDVDWNLDKTLAGSDPVRGPETDYPLFRAGEVRPVLNGDWLDLVVVFLPDGRASFPPSKYLRRRYDGRQAVNIHIFDYAKTPYTENRLFGNGVPDTCKAVNLWSETAEIATWWRHTGGFYATLAPDSPDDRDAFANAGEALRSMWPMVRVFVGRSGTVQVVPVRRDDHLLDGKTLFPADDAVWEAATDAHMTTLASRYRFGWLHQLNNPSTAPAITAITRDVDLVPQGTPPTDAIDLRMLTSRRWWIEP